MGLGFGAHQKKRAPCASLLDSPPRGPAKNSAHGERQKSWLLCYKGHDGRKGREKNGRNEEWEGFRNFVANLSKVSPLFFANFGRSEFMDGGAKSCLLYTSDAADNLL